MYVTGLEKNILIIICILVIFAVGFMFKIKDIDVKMVYSVPKVRFITNT